MEDVKQNGPENTGTKQKNKKGRGVLTRRGRAFAAILVAILVLACAYALATGKDIPSVVGSIVTVLLHAVMGI